MKNTRIEHRINVILNDRVDVWAEQFLIDRKAQGLAPGTLLFYQDKLNKLLHYFESVAVYNLGQIDASVIRQFLLYLQSEKHTPGGIHAYYRVLKTFLFWWEAEVEPEGWKNPIRKVKAPRLKIEPLNPVEIDTVRAMLKACNEGFTGVRDIAIFMFLLDSGLRANEFISLNLDDIDVALISIFVRDGKGGKPRTVFIGKKTRRAVRSYLKTRSDTCEALWVTRTGTRLTYSGLRQIVRRRAEKANVPSPQIHSFRRAFALICLRNGVDVYSLQRLMGHADLQILRRYLNQTTNDIQLAHQLGSPVDNAGI